MTQLSTEKWPKFNYYKWKPCFAATEWFHSFGPGHFSPGLYCTKLKNATPFLIKDIT